MADEKQYVRTDEHGVMRVGQTRVMLDSVIASWEQGHSPETIRQQYPSLSLEEVYGAITYCLARPEEIKEYVKRQDAVWAAARAEAERNPSPVVARLRALRRTGSVEQR